MFRIKIWNTFRKEKFPKNMVLLFFILCGMLSFGQNSLENSNALGSYPSKKARESLISFNKNKSNQKVYADSLLSLSNAYVKNGEFAEASLAIEKVLGIYTSLNDIQSIGKCYDKIASIFYYQGDYVDALSAFDRSITSYKQINYKTGIASAVNNKGAIYSMLGNYPKALNHYKKAVKLNETLNNKKQTASTVQNIGGIYLEMGDYEKAMSYFQIARKTYERISDKKTLSQVLNAIGEIYIRKKDYTLAMVHFDSALRLAKEVDDGQRILEAIFKLGEIFELQDNFKKSLVYHEQALQLAKKLKNTLYQSRSLIAIGLVSYKLGKKQLAIVNCKEGLKIATAIKTVAPQKAACDCLYKVYKSLSQANSALAYYEQSVSLQDSLQARQTSGDLLHMEFEKQILLDSIVQVEKETKLQIRHGQEVAKKVKQRNYLIISGCFVLVIAGGLWNRLNFAKKSKARLQVEKDLSEHLLLNILPQEIANELKEKGYVDAQDFEKASILFTDFKSFTETASKLSPQQLVEEINVCFKAFDAIMETYNIEKIKTIGDAYMAAGGLPKPDTKAVKNTISAALDLQEFITKRKIKNASQNRPAFEMRVGIHVGPIVAGIVGIKKFQYDIWGDTVNTASRIESNGAVGKVNISQDTYQLVRNEQDLAFEYRGKITAKGKGELEMYFVRKANITINPDL